MLYTVERNENVPPRSIGSGEERRTNGKFEENGRGFEERTYVLRIRGIRNEPEPTHFSPLSADKRPREFRLSKVPRVIRVSTGFARRRSIANALIPSDHLSIPVSSYGGREATFQSLYDPAYSPGARLIAASFRNAAERRSIRNHIGLASCTRCANISLAGNFTRYGCYHYFSTVKLPLSFFYLYLFESFRAALCTRTMRSSGN